MLVSGVVNILGDMSSLREGVHWCLLSLTCWLSQCHLGSRNLHLLEGSARPAHKSVDSVIDAYTGQMIHKCVFPNA